MPVAEHDAGLAPAATTVNAEGELPTAIAPPPTPGRETARVCSPAIVTTTPLPGTVISIVPSVPILETVPARVIAPAVAVAALGVNVIFTTGAGTSM